MLFYETVFIFVFLPLSLVLYYTLKKHTTQTLAFLGLSASSLVFYAWWEILYVPILLASIAWNYAFGLVLADRAGRVVLGLGIAGNLGLIGYFKYAGFFGSLAGLGGTATGSFGDVVIPLGISFFTFQQIAYLFDVYHRKIRPPRFQNYLLFVTFFPQLVAGPIVHHREMLPQFTARPDAGGGGGENSGSRHRDFAIGTSIFVMGLFKKVVIADNMAPFADLIFDGAARGVQLEFFEAWGGATAFGLQLYFDFSAYSDMATGLARMFGIRLPLNFFSPYKAGNIVQFWRRWHITLSRFLRDLLYIPLGGNRRGRPRRYANLMITMVLGGLWHGAGWTFIVWGALHGSYLIVQHGFNHVRSRWLPALRVPAFFAVGLTFALVTLAWVPFRASSMETSWFMLETMLGLRGISLPAGLGGILGDVPGLRFDGIHSGWLVAFRDLALHCLGGLAVVFFCPNVYEIMRRYNPVLTTIKKATRFEWRPSGTWALVLCLTAIVALVFNLNDDAGFLYYQF